MSQVIEHIRQDLKTSVDSHTKATGHKAFKEDVKTYGVKMAMVNKLAKQHFAGLDDRRKPAVFLHCEELWCSGVLEEAIVACRWAHAVHAAYKPDDIEIFERWLGSYVSNWAVCDTFCNHAVGALLETFPKTVKRLKTWTGSSNRWMRRGAAVSLIAPAKKGKFLEDILDIADRLRLDQDDLVQKGYGWLLKVASQAHQQEIYDYVMSHKQDMPRTALRYAIEKMPPTLRVKAMAR